MPRYAIRPDGALTDHGSNIGWVEGGTALSFNEGVVISPAARGWFKRKLNEMNQPKSKPPAEVFAEERNQVRENEPPTPHAREIPPEPKQGPEGDKTPAYAYWLRVYFPEEFMKRFAGRKVMGVRVPPRVDTKELPDLPKPETERAAGDIPESSMEKEAEEVWFHK